jgi:hypothetical protein
VGPVGHAERQKDRRPIPQQVACDAASTPLA